MSSSHLTPLDHMDEIEKQLAELQMVAQEARSPPRPKKVPPVVPPKKKAQPQVPSSSIVGLPAEPSYASKVVSSVPPNAPVYSNVASNSPAQHLDIANRNQYNKSPHLAQSMPFNSSQNSYSNIVYRNDIEELPPPPPPPPSHLSYPPSKLHMDPNMNDEEFIPPPSPVSSNYSELVRATTYPNYQNVTQFPQYQPEYATYGGSQASTYESLYEPINMRPQSAQSNNSLPPNYPPYRNGSARPAVPKEREVDSLTDILIKNIAGNHEDVYGICIKCGKNIVGETAGCTAMGNMYHVKCFTCHICNGNLQGKPFYAVESKPYCEQDYIETLEKCSVCTKPIMDRILRATGKPYHPACFTCVVCGKSLDGIPFTVDAMNQIHCIEDFHKKFAPRCSVCSLPIMPEEGQEETVRVVALDRSFHVRCYRCEDCGLLLSSEAEGRGCYPLDNHILCKSCNAHRVRLLTNVMTTDL